MPFVSSERIADFRELSDQEFAMLLDTVEESFVTYPNKPEVYQ